jgi:hypothetical protein
MEKIIYILNLFLILYIIYREFCNKKGIENFENVTLGSADDQNAINKLAQIATQLMAGGVTIPGNMTVKGGSIATGEAPGQTPGTIVSNMGDSWGMLWGSNCALIGQKGKTMRFGFADAYNAAGWDEKVNIQPDGTMNTFAINARAPINAGNDISVGRDLHFPNATTIRGNQRLHISSNEILYLLPKSGVTIGREWGGNGNLNVQGNLTFNGEQVNVIYPAPWNHQWWTEKMASYFNRGEPDGIKREFLIIHPGGMDVNHSHRWTVWFVAIKQGRQVYFFEPHHRHENIPNPANHDSNDINWRRTIP